MMPILTSKSVQLLEAVKRVKPLCTTTIGVEYTQMARLLHKAGFHVAVKSPEGECKCPDKSRKCLEKLTHTFLTYTNPGQVRAISGIDQIALLNRRVLNVDAIVMWFSQTSLR